MRGIIAALALGAISGAAVAAPPPAPPTPCITRAQVQDVTLFAMPSVLDAVASRCRASLPVSAYLLNGGHELSQRLAAGSAAHWVGAVAVMKAFGDKKMPEGISADTARSLVRDVITGELLKTTTPADCARIDEGARLLAPLPPENIGALFALALDAMGDKKGGPPKLCR